MTEGRGKPHYYPSIESSGYLLKFEEDIRVQKCGSEETRRYTILAKQAVSGETRRYTILAKQAVSRETERPGDALF